MCNINILLKKGSKEWRKTIYFRIQTLGCSGSELMYNDSTDCYVLLLHKLCHGVESWTEMGQVEDRMVFLLQLWGSAAGEKELGQYGILVCTPLSCTI